ncbi:MAG: CRTAC1 family protein [Acidobacteriota bacterium]
MQVNPSRMPFLVLVLGALAACGGPVDDSRAEKSAGVSSRDAVWFEDIAAKAGVDRVAVCGNRDKDHILETLGTGVAIADYDNDGDQDFYLATAQTSDDWLNGDKPRANGLYRNDGDGIFVDVAAESGVDLRAWSLGAYFVDYDNDGDKDLFVTTWGPNVLYVNNGDGTFTDGTAAAGLGTHDVWSASAAFGDLDLDGDLDLYIANYAKYSLIDPPHGGAKITWRGMRVLMGPIGLEGESDRLYRNNGDGTFTDITSEAGIAAPVPHFGLGVVFSDLDKDGDPDIFVANDSMANFLWRNEGSLRFRDVSLGAGVATNQNATEQAGMGADAGDYDEDGWTDLVVTNFSHDFNTLHRNRGGLLFTDATYTANFKDSYSYLAWGVKFVDYDLDGWLDVFMANGHTYSILETNKQSDTTYKQVNSIYRNRRDGSFEPRGAAAGPALEIVESTRGLAVGDLDGNGAPDFIVTNIDAPPTILMNRGADGRRWLHVSLEGTRSNRDGVGARIELTADGRTQSREVNPFGSFLSQSTYDVMFGLGQADVADRIVVRWPSGIVDEIDAVPAGRRVRIVEGVGLVEDPE